MCGGRVGLAVARFMLCAVWEGAHEGMLIRPRMVWVLFSVVLMVTAVWMPVARCHTT